MMPMKRKLKNIALYLVCFVATTAAVYAVFTYSAEKTLHLDSVRTGIQNSLILLINIA